MPRKYDFIKRTVNNIATDLPSGNGSNKKRVVVDELPEVGQPDTIYDIYTTVPGNYKWGLEYSNGMNNAPYVVETEDELVDPGNDSDLKVYVRSTDKMFEVTGDFLHRSFSEMTKIGQGKFESEVWGNVYVVRNASWDDIDTFNVTVTYLDGSTEVLNIDSQQDKIPYIFKLVEIDKPTCIEYSEYYKQCFKDGMYYVDDIANVTAKDIKDFIFNSTKNGVCMLDGSSPIYNTFVIDVNNRMYNVQDQPTTLPYIWDCQYDEETGVPINSTYNFYYKDLETGEVDYTRVYEGELEFCSLEYIKDEGNYNWKTYPSSLCLFMPTEDTQVLNEYVYVDGEWYTYGDEWLPNPKLMDTTESLKSVKIGSKNYSVGGVGESWQINGMLCKLLFNAIQPKQEMSFKFANLKPYLEGIDFDEVIYNNTTETGRVLNIGLFYLRSLQDSYDEANSLNIRLYGSPLSYTPGESIYKLEFTYKLTDGYSKVETYDLNFDFTEDPILTLNKMFDFMDAHLSDIAQTFDINNNILDFIERLTGSSHIEKNLALYTLFSSDYYGTSAWFFLTLNDFLAILSLPTYEEIRKYVWPEIINSVFTD